MNTIDVRCPDCDGRGFTRQGPLEHGKGRAMFCDRCDGRGTFPYHVDDTEPIKHERRPRSDLEHTNDR